MSRPDSQEPRPEGAERHFEEPWPEGAERHFKEPWPEGAERHFKEPWPEGAERHFKEPWEAQAFALAVRLSEAGCFTWTEWSETLGAVLREQGAAADDDGSRYYLFWLEALERLVTAKGLIAVTDVTACAARWAQAYRETPHGRPVTLV